MLAVHINFFMEGMIFMRTSLKRLSIFVIVMMFFAVMSAGCGGGGGDSNNVSQENGNNSGWDTDPDEQNQNQNQDQNQNNNNGNNNNDNQNGNNNGDNGNNDNGNQNNNGSPVTINGTWEIISGEYTLSGGKMFSYLPGHLGTFEIIVKENTGNMYGGYASGFYTILLRGVNVTGIEDAGYTEISVPFDDNIPPADTTYFHAPLCGGRDFRYSNDSVMIETDEDVYNGEGAKVSTIYEKKYTLIDNSTIKYTYFMQSAEARTPGLPQTTDITVELTLKRVK